MYINVTNKEIENIAFLIVYYISIHPFKYSFSPATGTGMFSKCSTIAIMKKILIYKFIESYKMNKNVVLG